MFGEELHLNIWLLWCIVSILCIGYFVAQLTSGGHQMAIVVSL